MKANIQSNKRKIKRALFVWNNRVQNILMCRSTISWFVFAASIMIVSFVVFFYCILTYLY
ncbi:hypothetical protein NC651_009425 [Populus alba x Populus x berolinensis]|nr:hypothetical protein NC651_009425 [Populus alba x Populus x berolinensis]